MAAYAKDDYYTASDFSDLSDDETKQNNSFAESFDFESDGEDTDNTYCICRQPGTTQMVACDNDLCEIEWFHYECVGLTAETIPEDSWICDRCRPAEHQIEAEVDAVTEPTVTTEPTPVPHAYATPTMPTPSTGGETGVSEAACPADPSRRGATSKIRRPRAAKGKNKDSAEGPKEPKKKRKAAERPPAIFSKEDAMGKSCSYFQEGLHRIRSHPVYSASYPIALCIMALVNNMLAHVNTPEFNNFSVFLMANVWLIATAGVKEKLWPDASAMMWRAFEDFRCSGDHVNKWHEFLSSLYIHDEGKHTHIVLYQVLQTMLELLLKDSHTTDKPSESNDEQQQISCEEEQVLRYVAGYIPFALYKKFQTHKNKTAEIYCKLLYSWKVSSCNSVKTFLDYTNEWIKLQNRGGLFRVSDDLYLFFRTIENECRSLLTKSNLDSFPGKNIASSLFEKVLAQRRVHTYWCSLTESKIKGDNSKCLLDIIVKYYIKIRCKAFIKVYLDLKKASAKQKSGEKKVSKKAEKALRKELASPSTSKAE